jgi:prepilin peptidase CpaA
VVINVMLLTTLAICVITDLRSRKIYNVLIFPGLLVALVYHFAVGGWFSFGNALSGFLVGLSVLLIPYLLGGMGAGDVKLLALVGALKGSAFVLLAALYMALLGGIIALILLLGRKGSKERIHWLLISLYSLRYGVKMPLLLHKDNMTMTYPYGVAIAGGAILGLWLKGLGIVW